MSKPIPTRRVAVATSSKLAAEAAQEIAERGGNAVDCAIAAAMVTMNTEPGVCALAGGAYVTIWAPDRSPVTIDGNVAIPGLAFAGDPARTGAVALHMEYGGGIDTLVGPGAVAVPGSLAALTKASGEFGRIEWRHLLAPSIRAANDGFALPRACHYYLRFSGEAVFGRSVDGYSALHRDDGTLRDVGERIRVPHLGDTLARIADEGCRGFYEGDIARTMVTHVQAGGGRLSMDDMRTYRAIERPSLDVSLDAWQVAVNPPPAVGGAVLAAMLLAFRDESVPEWDESALRSLLRVQQAVLGFRREHLDLSDDRSRDAAKLIDMARSSGMAKRAASASTVHTSAVDNAGLGCAITASSGYGSGEMPDGTGLWLNNCLGELELNRYGVSAAPAGARLPSNMTPAVARRANAVLALGSPGADRITTAMHQFLVNFARRGLSLRDAIAHPRMHLEFAADGMKVALEPGLELGECDLPVTRYPELGMYFGGVGAALFDADGDFAVAADPRREGATFMSPP